MRERERERERKKEIVIILFFYRCARNSDEKKRTVFFLSPLFLSLVRVSVTANDQRPWRRRHELVQPTEKRAIVIVMTLIANRFRRPDQTTAPPPNSQGSRRFGNEAVFFFVFRF